MASVLVVDDASFMRMRLRKILEEQGYEILEASNGAEAVLIFRQERPDLVLMDITMPEMDGLSALKKIKSEFPDAKVVMCSALGQEKVVIESVKSGARDFIVKPFQPDHVIKVVKRHLGE